jgi:thiol-disulfide isomerase/thioredoxin
LDAIRPGVFHQLRFRSETNAVIGREERLEQPLGKEERRRKRRRRIHVAALILTDVTLHEAMILTVNGGVAFVSCSSRGNVTCARRGAPSTRALDGAAIEGQQRVMAVVAMQGLRVVLLWSCSTMKIANACFSPLRNPRSTARSSQAISSWTRNAYLDFTCSSPILQRFNGIDSFVLHRRSMSVSGVIYKDSRSEKGSSIRDVIVTLFTKEGCTLCDKVQSVLEATSEKYPHSLVAVDITDSEYRDEWFERYKFDIPVLHINGAYWTKHRITLAEAELGLATASKGVTLVPIGSEPDARQSRPRSSSL